MLVINSPFKEASVTIQDTLTLSNRWEALKINEEVARNDRLQVELQMIALGLTSEPGKSKTHKAQDYRVVTTQPISYRGPVEKVIAVARALGFEPPVKYSLDDSACKKLFETSKVEYSLLSEEGGLIQSIGKVGFQISRVATAIL